MRKFILLTTSYSYDHYHYFIECDNKPTKDDLYGFLVKYGNDKNMEDVFEDIDEVIEIKDELFVKI